MFILRQIEESRDNGFNARVIAAYGHFISSYRDLPIMLQYLRKDNLICCIIFARISSFFLFYLH